MTLAQLRYLLAIVDADLNITTAAERVNATQPGLSKQLKLLEEELGFQIFVRRGKSLERLSAAGAEVAARARLIVAEAANIQTLAANQRGDSQGELVIATTQTQARFVLPAALQLLKARYPQVTVKINLFGDVECSRTAASDADVLIASQIERPQSAEPVVPLYSWRRVALFPASHPLAQSEGPLTPAELAAYPLIGYESALGTHSSVTAAFAKAGLEAKFAYATHDTEVIKTYVRSGLGVGLLAEMALVGDADLTHRAIVGLPVCGTYAQLQPGRVARDYVVDFVGALAPQATRREVVRSLAGSAARLELLDWDAWRDRVETQVARHGLTGDVGRALAAA